MKFLTLSGDAALRRVLIERLVTVTAGSLGVLEIAEEGPPFVRFPSAEALRIVDSMPPDLLIVPAGAGYAAPVVLCGEDDPACALTIARFAREEDPVGLPPVLAPDSPTIRFTELMDRVSPALPQRAAEDCGRCGGDCMTMAKRLVAGTAVISDCRVLSEADGVRVFSGDRELELSGFPARMVENTVRALVSGMKGSTPGGAVTVHLGPSRQRSST